MKSTEITVVVSSRKRSDEASDFVSHINSTCGYPCRIVFVTNDGSVGLSKLYANMLSNTQIETQIIVFIHDDIEFLKPGWGKEIVRLFNSNRKYGIIGVAGSAQFDEMGAWWNYKHIYGQVLHKHEGKSWLSQFSPLLDKDLEEVCVIDGLFIAVERSRISSNFDATLEGFNWYDIVFCLSNYIGGRCKIGVTTNIRVAHKSIGALSDNWYSNKEKVMKAFSKYLPIDMPKPNDSRK